MSAEGVQSVGFLHLRGGMPQSLCLAGAIARMRQVGWGKFSYNEDSLFPLTLAPH